MKILNTILRQISEQMFTKRFALNLSLLLSIALTVNSEWIKDLKAEKARTIDKDICTICPDGRIDTGFVRTSSDPKTIPENYIFKDQYFWRLSYDLKTLYDRIITETSEEWKGYFDIKLGRIDMAFAMESGLSVYSYFIKFNPIPSKWYRFVSGILWPNAMDDGGVINIPEISDSSVAFWVYPESYPYDDTVLFISQNRINELLVERKYTFLDYKDMNHPETIISEEDKPDIPEFILKLDSKYWIKAVLEVKKSVGMIFLEYNNTGLHCYFNKTVNSCTNNGEIITNTKLFGCRDPKPIPLFSIKELSSTEKKEPQPTTSGLIYFLFDTVYKIVVIILIIIILILFVFLPFVHKFKR